MALMPTEVGLSVPRRACGDLSRGGPTKWARVALLAGASSVVRLCWELEKPKGLMGARRLAGPGLPGEGEALLQGPRDVLRTFT
jgi:hypothetical protein